MRFAEFRTILYRFWPRFVRFGIVGGSGVFVDMGMMFALADPKMLGWNLSLAKVLAAELAIVNNFVWNDRWTFRDHTVQPGSKAAIRRFAAFNLICASGILINLGMLNLFVYRFHFNLLIGNFISIGLVSLWNFWMSLKHGWTKPECKSIPSL